MLGLLNIRITIETRRAVELTFLLMKRDMFWKGHIGLVQDIFMKFWGQGVKICRDKSEGIKDNSRC